jgi:hypothetical protein
MTRGRGSNLIGTIFSAGLGAGGVGTGFSSAGFARDALVIAGFALTVFDAGFVGFTVTFDVAMGLAFVDGRAAFLGAAAL